MRKRRTLRVLAVLWRFDAARKRLLLGRRHLISSCSPARPLAETLLLPQGDGHHNRGNALYKLSRFSDAIGAFERAVEVQRLGRAAPTPRPSTYLDAPR